jgi:hypothetical protein
MPFGIVSSPRAFPLGASRIAYHTLYSMISGKSIGLGYQAWEISLRSALGGSRKNISQNALPLALGLVSLVSLCMIIGMDPDS